MQMENSRHPKAVQARFDALMDRIVVSLDSGLELMFPPHLAQGLEHAKPDELATIEINHDGMGLHWPALDAGLYVPGVLDGVFGSRKWTAARMTRPGQGRPERKDGTANSVAAV